MGETCRASRWSVPPLLCLASQGLFLSVRIFLTDPAFRQLLLCGTFRLRHAPLLGCLPFCCCCSCGHTLLDFFFPVMCVCAGSVQQAHGYLSRRSAVLHLCPASILALFFWWRGGLTTLMLDNFDAGHVPFICPHPQVKEALSF